MEKVVELIDRVICNIDDTEVLKKVKKEVNDMMGARKLFAW